MNRRGGIFGFVIVLVLLAMLVWIWAIIMPSVTPSIDSTIAATSSDPYADGIGFFLRAIPWAVPFIIIIGMLWVGATK